MANLDSILKSRDVTLPTKVCLVKAMVFPVVMYGCESWTVKKAECKKKKKKKNLRDLHILNISEVFSTAAPPILCPVEIQSYCQDF